MDKHLIGGRVDLAELESIFGLRFDITVDEKEKLYLVRAIKDPFYRLEILTESMVKDMSDENLRLCMKNLANEIFNEYCKHIF